MSLIKKSLINICALVSVTGFSQTSLAQAEIVLDQADNAFIVVERQGGKVVDAYSDNPDLLEVIGEPDCINSSAGTCDVIVRLHKDGPVNLMPYDSSGFLNYGQPLVNEAANTMDIDLGLWGGNRFFIAGALTQNALSPELNGHVTLNQGLTEMFNRNVNQRDTYVEISIRFYNISPSHHPSTFQKFRVIVSATSSPYFLLGRNTPATYVTQDSNKGPISGNFSADGSLYGMGMTSFFWNQGSGHYAALRFFTNGENATDQGLDLSEFKTVKARIGCPAGLTYEVILGDGNHDSTQTWLGDIQCDDFVNDYTFNIPQGLNLSDIQTGLWFHLPTWKNPTNITYDVYLNVFEIVFND